MNNMKEGIYTRDLLPTIFVFPDRLILKDTLLGSHTNVWNCGKYESWSCWSLMAINKNKPSP